MRTRASSTPAQRLVATTVGLLLATMLMFASSADASHPAAPPSIQIDTPSDGQTFLQGEQIKASYSCADQGSGVQSCTGDVPSGSNLDTSTLGSHTFTVAAQDSGGATSTKQVSYSVVGARTTGLVADIDPGGGSSNPDYLTGLGDDVYLGAFDPTWGSSLFKSDGTAAGTTDVGKGVAYGASYVTNVGGELYFSAYDSTYSNYGLWKSNGTTAGTSLVKALPSGDYLQAMAAVGGTAFFTVYSSNFNTSELWKSDGTAAGTVALATGLQYAYELTAVAGRLYFAGRTAGVDQLWTSDGTGAGTQMVKDIQISGYLSAVGSTVYFEGYDPSYGGTLWKSDGTAAGTTTVADPGKAQYLQNLANVGGTLYFSAYDGSHGYELWKSDGTAAGTTLVKDINPGSAYSNPSNLTDVGGTLYFLAYDPDHGNELWKSDGTADGTTLVKDVNPGTADSTPVNNPAKLTNVGGTLYFTADDGADGRELWSSDGTAAGTTLVQDIYPGSTSSNPSLLTNVDGTLYFGGTDPDHGAELWRVAMEGAIDGAPAASDFGDGGIATSTSAHSVTFTNHGPGKVTVSGTSLAGSNPADFAIFERWLQRHDAGCRGHMSGRREDEGARRGSAIGNALAPGRSSRHQLRSAVRQRRRPRRSGHPGFDARGWRLAVPGHRGEGQLLVRRRTRRLGRAVVHGRAR